VFGVIWQVTIIRGNMFCQQCSKQLEGSFCRRCRLDWQAAESKPASPICSIQDLVGKTWNGGGYPGEAYYKMKFIGLYDEKILAAVVVDFPYGGNDKGFAVVTCDGFGYEHRYFNTEIEARAAL